MPSGFVDEVLARVGESGYGLYFFILDIVLLSLSLAHDNEIAICDEFCNNVDESVSSVIPDIIDLS